MLKNHVKIAYRYLMRNRSFTLINILGLSVGLASSLLIFLVLRFEYSFDQHHQNYDQIYRVNTYLEFPDGRQYIPGIPVPMLEAARLDIPDYLAFSPLDLYPRMKLSLQDEEQQKRSFQESQTVFASESSLFDIFDFEMLAGSSQALDQPGNILLSQSRAFKYFKTQNYSSLIGKSLELENIGKLKVSGIYKNPPLNSDFPLHVLFSYASALQKMAKEEKSNWASISSDRQCYLLMPPKYPQKKRLSLVQGFEKKYQKLLGDFVHIELQALSDIHFNFDYGNFNDRIVSQKMLIALSLIGFFLILMASFNFINLALAQTLPRSREIGIRKVMGGVPSQLITQFLTETAFLVGISIIFAILLVEISLPFIAQTLQIPLKSQALFSIDFLLILLSLWVLVSLFSGYYPAWLLANFRPIQALKGHLNSGIKTKRFDLRKTLVITQFCITQVLIVGSLIVMQQMNLIQTIDMGFKQEAILLVPLPVDKNGEITKGVYNRFKDNFSKIPAVESLSLSNRPPASQDIWFTNIDFPTQKTKFDFQVNYKSAESNYFDFYQLEFVAGKAYAPNSEGKYCVINETLAHKLGYMDPQEMIGKPIKFSGQNRRISGVLKDFHLNSLHKSIDPCIIAPVSPYFYTANVKIHTQNIGESIQALKTNYEKLYPNQAFEYEFLDQKIAQFYEQETRLAFILSLFTGVAILIASLGLYGLILFVTRRRRKELGIRKVLGASVPQILWLISKEFLILLGLSLLVSLPLAYSLMQTWLTEFSYRIQIGWEVFAGGILISLLIAGISSSYHTVKAAYVNPVETLQNE